MSDTKISPGAAALCARDAMGLDLGAHEGVVLAQEPHPALVT